MTNRTSLTPAEMRELLNRIKLMQEKYKGLMDSLDKAIRVDMERGWRGSAANAYHDVYNGFSRSFMVKFANLLDTYGLVLNDTAREIGYDDQEIARQIRAKLG